MAKSKKSTKKSGPASGKSKKTRKFSFGRLRVMPIDMKFVYAAYD